MTLDTFDVYCVARTDNDTHNQFESIVISNTDNPFWNESFTLDSRVVFKVLKFTVWMAFKRQNTGDVCHVPVGKVCVFFKIVSRTDPFFSYGFVGCHSAEIYEGER
jgi:hypothetical protein